MGFEKYVKSVKVLVGLFDLNVKSVKEKVI